MKKSTKDRIIESAANLFYKKGFEETTFADISKLVKITQPACYSHFANKMDLLKSVCLWSAEQGRLYIDKEVKDNDSALIRFQSYVFANFNFFKKNKIHSHSIMAIYFFSSSKKEIFEVFKVIQEVGLRRIETFLIKGVLERAWKVKDTKATAEAINSFLIGECYKAIYFVKIEDIEKFQNRTWKVILLMINEK